MSPLATLRAPGAPLESTKRAASRLFWSLLLPLGVTLAALRGAVPSRMEGGPGELRSLVARFADESPLILGIFLFIAVSETIGYWRDRLGATSRTRTPAFETGARPSARRVARVVAAVAVAAVLALGFRSSVAELHRVVSVSMLPTLNVGDRLLVDKLAYGLKLPLSNHRIGAKLPRRGEVIVFPGAENQDGAAATPKPIVKRVLGLPGDYISFQLGHAIVNNWIVPTCDAGPFAAVMGKLTIRGRLAVEFLEDKTYLTVTTPGGASFPGYRVLPGEVFVIGDDRGISSDSRVWNSGRGGGVAIDAIEGRVTRILAGGRRDGRIDLHHLLSPLGLQIREPDVDLHKSETFISNCLQTPPASTWPPASGA